MTQFSLQELHRQGYRFVSRKWGMVSRIDRPDWKEHMAISHSPWSLEEGLEWVALIGEEGAEDHYRRVYSKDTIEIEPEYQKKAYEVLGSSCGAVTGYCE